MDLLDFYFDSLRRDNKILRHGIIENNVYIVFTDAKGYYCIIVDNGIDKPKFKKYKSKARLEKYGYALLD